MNHFYPVEAMSNMAILGSVDRDASRWSAVAKRRGATQGKSGVSAYCHTLAGRRICTGGGGCILLRGEGVGSWSPPHTNAGLNIPTLRSVSGPARHNRRNLPEEKMNTSTVLCRDSGPG
jgi:hypothetical protein